MISRRWDRLSDEEVLRRMQHGEKYGLTVLYERYSKKLVRYFHRMLWKDEAKAQDFLHDLFVRIIDKHKGIKADKKFSTWIYSVAFNMCKNEYRKQAFRSSNNGSGEFIKETFQPEVDHLNFSNGLRKILLESDEGERNLFVLRYELDIPLSEIAVILECPEGTVKSRLFYLKKKLSKQFQEYNPLLN